jgi:hypothetical protein
VQAVVLAVAENTEVVVVAMIKVTNKINTTTGLHALTVGGSSTMLRLRGIFRIARTRRRNRRCVWALLGEEEPAIEDDY